MKVRSIKRRIQSKRPKVSPPIIQYGAGVVAFAQKILDQIKKEEKS